MKKHIFILAVTAVLTLAVAVGQASASTNYTVQRGDTLWDISRAHSVSVENLQDWNDLDSTVIFPSQTLIIKPDVADYTVIKGDTLFDIAEEHNISLHDLIRWNELTSDLIHPGDQLSLDGTAKEQMKSKSPATTSPNPSVANTSPPSTSTKEMAVTATAYTAYCAGCSGVTYTGIDLRANPNQKVIAVDPNVIPLGSRVWVEGYGEAIAGDIGGAIKGNIIDVFLEHKQDALNWGRKTVTIKILE